jgi:general secretion pathway protein A
MYERFYDLRERPFALTPDPAYLYLSRVHSYALDYLRLGIETGAGFIVVTGEVGSGKTMLLQTLLRQLEGRATVARLVNTLLEPRELLEAILIDFGVDPVPQSKPAMIRDLARFLVEERAQNRRVLIVIDEAQNLSRGALEELRMLSNLETEKSKLMQIVLVGQPDLRRTLISPNLEQLRQRIAVRYHVPPLDAEETGNYINHRLRVAARSKPLQLARPITDAIYERSRGIPRMINVICDAVLFIGYGEERAEVDASLTAAAFEELESTGVLKPLRGRRPEAAARPAARPSPRAAPSARAAEPSGTASARTDERPADKKREAADLPLRPPPERHVPGFTFKTPESQDSPRIRTAWDRTKRFLFDLPPPVLKDG